MELISILNKKSCDIDVVAKNKDDLLRKIAHLGSFSEQLENIPEDRVYELLKAREEQGTTGFGDEIAIPHARIEGMKEFILFIVVCPRGVDFESLDKKRVKICFVILGPPENVNEHLKILAAVSRTANRSTVKNELLKSPSVTALYETFLRHAGESPPSTTAAKKMKLLFIVLYIEEFLYDILELFIKEGIEGATVMESSGMGAYISSVPLFAEFIGFMKEDKNRSKTIMAFVPERHLPRLVEEIESITGDLTQKEGAMVFAIDIPFYKGTMKMM